METFWHDLTGWTARTFVIKRAKLALKYSSTNEANHLRLWHLHKKKDRKKSALFKFRLKALQISQKGKVKDVPIYVPVGFQTEVHSIV